MKASVVPKTDGKNDCFCSTPNYDNGPVAASHLLIVEGCPVLEPAIAQPELIIGFGARLIATQSDRGS